MALSRAGKSLSDLARHLDRSQPSVSERISGDGEIDSIWFLKGVAELTGQSFNWLMDGEEGEASKEIPMEMREPSTEYYKGKTIRPIAVTVSPTGKELISYVPVKAQAGYMRGFGDPQFIERLPAFNLPVNINGTVRMFQVDGISMRQLGGGGLNDGDIVIAQYVEDIFTVKDGRVYVVVSTEGIIIKRCINRLLTEDKVLVCNSDNKSGDYPPIILHAPEILEVWELKAFISKQLSLATDLWDVINNMQVQQALMADRLKEIERKQLSS